MSGQVLRFAISGGLVTVLAALAYWLVAELLGIDPNLSLTLVFLVLSVVSFLLHSRWTFSGHGSRDRPHVRGARFLLTNLLGFGINQVFIWLLVKVMGGANWWPIVPMILVTPLVTFTLSRRWVFDGPSG